MSSETFKDEKLVVTALLGGYLKEVLTNFIVIDCSESTYLPGFTFALILDDEYFF